MTTQLDERTESMYGDLVAALAELTELPRGRTANVGSYSYTYADLGDALSAVRPVLARHGLAVVQLVHGEPGTISVQTVLVHRSGERFESPTLTVAVQGGSQAVGSAITYARRYSLMATLGLGTDDDDGAAASAPGRTPSAPARVIQPQSRRETDPPPRAEPSGSAAQTPQQRRLHAALSRLHLSGRDDKLEWCSRQLGREVTSSDDLTDDERARLIDIAEELSLHDPWAPLSHDDERGYGDG